MIDIIKRLIILWLLLFTFLTEAKADISCPATSGSDSVSLTMPALDVASGTCTYNISGFDAIAYNNPGAQPLALFPFTAFLPDGLTLSSPPNPARFVMHTGSAVAIFSSASCSGATISGLSTNALDVALNDGASCALTFGADSDNQGFSGATLSRSGLVYSITAGALSGGPYGGTYTAPSSTKAEPTNHPTAFTATANSTSQITTAWTDATDTVIPDSYLLMCSTSNAFTNPVDTTAQTNDTDCSDGAGVQNLSQGTGTVVWTGLTAGTQYFYKIYPYTNTGADVDYKIDGTVLEASATTTSPPTAPTINGTNGTTITGTGEVGATVTVRDASNTVIGTAVVAANGNWTMTANPVVGNATVLTATQAHTVGNDSSASNPQTVDTINDDATLTSSSTVTEPVHLASTADTEGEALSLFDFTISDGGGGDALSTDVSQIVLNTSGTADFSKVTWRLNGAAVSNVVGTYDSGANTLTFTGLSVSVDDGTNETYTLSGFYHEPSNLTNNQTYIFSLNGDNDLTVSGSGTQMSGGNSAVNNGLGTQVDITATKLIFQTEPSN